MVPLKTPDWKDKRKSKICLLQVAGMAMTSWCFQTIFGHVQPISTLEMG
jgi:hypothetical protein